MPQPPEQCPDEYRCPGEAAPISRAVHLGRLARFYPGCRECPHREQTASLPARQVKRLAETWQRAAVRPLFHREGAGSDSPNDFTPATARKIAAAFGAWLRGGEGGGAPLCEAGHRPGVERGPLRQMSPDPLPSPVAAIGADGSPRSPELVAAVAEGLRWAGCGVVDVGPVTSACFTLALHSLGADGGILAGSGEGVRAVGLKFWHGASPLSAGEAMDEIRRLFETGVNRPTRYYGPICRFPAETSYLAGLSGHYHALRPLGVIVETASRPLLAYLDTLTAHTACRIIPCRASPERLAELIRQEKAHFGVGVDSDAECCRAIDESGRAIPPERLFLLVARHLLAAQPGAAVALEAGWSESLAQAIAGLGSRVVPGGPLRAEMARQVCGHCAPLGADCGGRIWYCRSNGVGAHLCEAGHRPEVGRGPFRQMSPDPFSAADALRTITLLLEILSQSDRPLSEVLDAAWPAR